MSRVERNGRTDTTDFITLLANAIGNMMCRIQLTAQRKIMSYVYCFL